jgi:TolB protein
VRRFTIALLCLTAGVSLLVACGDDDADSSGEEEATTTETAESEDSEAPGILFQRREGLNTDVYLIQPDGSGLTQLTDDPGEDYEPRWSPGYDQIAFVSDRDGVSQGQIYVMNPDGSNQRRITTSEATDDYPNWSPDGSTLIFQRSSAGLQNAERSSDIWTVDVETGEETQLTTEEAWDSTPSYSPDGQTITFESDRAGPFEIWNMDADGSNPRQLTELGGSAFASRFSPDGSQIAFNLRGEEARVDVWIMNADGSDQRMLMDTAQLNEMCPAWSPDGQFLVYHVFGEGELAADIAYVEVENPEEIRITETPEIREETPDWSGY